MVSMAHVVKREWFDISLVIKLVGGTSKVITWCSVDCLSKGLGGYHIPL